MGNSNQNGAGWSENEPFTEVDTYNGETKDGKRHGRGIYFYPNGDIYDGEWRKSEKYGHGTYIYSNDQKLEGFFYHDKHIGDEPNKKMRKRMAKEEKNDDKGDIPISKKEKIKESLRAFTDYPAPKIKADGAEKRREASKERNAWLRQKYLGES